MVSKNQQGFYLFYKIMNDKKVLNQDINLITLTSACELLKVHPNTLRIWDKNGTLPAIRIGPKKVRRYKKEDIIKFLETHN